MMTLKAIIAEVEAAAQQEAAGIHILETTRFEPELGKIAGSCLAAAKRRAEALSQAQLLLRALDHSPFAQIWMLFPGRVALAWHRWRSLRVIRRVVA